MTDSTTPVWAVELANRLDRIEAALAIPARQSRWLLLEHAAPALGYGSRSTLLRAIRAGRIPPSFVRSERSPLGRRVRTAVDVEGFRQSLRLAR